MPQPAIDLTEVLGLLPLEECLCGEDNVYGYTAEQMHSERERCYKLGLERRLLDQQPQEN